MPDRSDLGDLIVEHGPLKPGDPDPMHSLTLGDFNALRDELIRLRHIEVQLADRRCAGRLGRRRRRSRVISDRRRRRRVLRLPALRRRRSGAVVVAVHMPTRGLLPARRGGAVTTYRTVVDDRIGRWGLTIVRTGDPDQLVAVVVNGDQALAERICALLNADGTEPFGAKRDWVADNSPQLAEWLSEQAVRRGRPHTGPVGPGCICDGSGRTCPRHGAGI